MKSSSQRLPGLDGMRALALPCVLFSHLAASEGWVYREWIHQLQCIFLGMFGLQVFFTLSGFIITLLLLREKQKSGTISLTQFWLRRALRILPPAVAYLLFLQVLAVGKLAPVALETQLGSLLLYRNLMATDPWFSTDQGFTAHYWSLSLEEHFYLIWPILVMILSTSSLLKAAWWGTAFSVLWRLCAPWIFPAENERWLPTHLDGFMIGAVVAVAVATGASARWVALWRFRWPLLVFALALTRIYASTYREYVIPLQPLVVAVTCGVWIAGLIRNPPGFESRLLNARPVVALGLISYSVYLWQQLCLAPSFQWTSGKAPWLTVYPQNILTALACGVLSYLLIEKPSQRLKIWMVKRSLSRAAAASAPCPP